MRRINAMEAPEVTTGYSQAVEIGRAKRSLFISGQIPVDRAGEVPKDFASQCRLVWRNILAQLNAAGMGIENLVKVTIFLSSREYSLENRAIRNEMLQGHAPALTVIITGIFDDAWLLEIEAIAAEEE